MAKSEITRLLDHATEVTNQKLEIAKFLNKNKGSYKEIKSNFIDSAFDCVNLTKNTINLCFGSIGLMALTAGALSLLIFYISLIFSFSMPITILLVAIPWIIVIFLTASTLRKTNNLKKVSDALKWEANIMEDERIENMIHSNLSAN